MGKHVGWTQSMIDRGNYLLYLKLLAWQRFLSALQSKICFFSFILEILRTIHEQMKSLIPSPSHRPAIEYVCTQS